MTCSFGHFSHSSSCRGHNWSPPMGCGSSVPKRVATYDYDAIIQDFENKLLRPLPSQHERDFNKSDPAVRRRFKKRVSSWNLHGGVDQGFAVNPNRDDHDRHIDTLRQYGRKLRASKGQELLEVVETARNLDSGRE